MTLEPITIAINYISLVSMTQAVIQALSSRELAWKTQTGLVHAYLIAVVNVNKGLQS